MSFKRFITSAVLATFLFVGHAFATDTYVIDASHSEVEFAVKHLQISTVKGNFTEFEGTIHYNPEDITQSSVEVTINTASVDTDNQKRDDHLRSDDFFNAEEYPNITFKSTEIKKEGDQMIMVGDLTIRGTTNQVEFPFTLNGPVELGGHFGTRLGAEGDLKIDRGDYNVSFGLGEIAVGNEVKIHLVVEAIKQ